MELFLIIFAVVLLVVCVVLGAVMLAGRRRGTDLTQKTEQLFADVEAERTRTEEYRQALQAREIELARANAEIEKLREKGDHDKAELEKLQASFRIEFKNLANDMLEEKSRQFKLTNKESIDQLLNPFKDSLGEFRKRVEDIYSHDNEQRGYLKSELKTLLELNQKITQETNNLTSALRGNSKMQGDWGEVILDTILESSSLIKGIHYTMQENLKDEAGNNLRPDAILTLPEGKKIIIDSKVSLTAYARCSEAEDSDSRDRFLKEHIRSVRSHVDELGKKRYQELIDSPDFVIMFIPTEPAFLAALQGDNTIWNDAYKKKVIVSSPTNLFALLKIVDDLWKRDSQSRNTRMIAEESVRMLDKLAGFVTTLEAVGKNINAASDSYEKAMGQLKTGNGNLVGRVDKLRKLGVKASKPLPATLVAPDEDADEEPEDEDVAALQE